VIERVCRRAYGLIGMALLMLLLAMPTGAASACEPQLGLDVEVYAPPLSLGDAVTANWKKAYDCGDNETAFALASRLEERAARKQGKHAFAAIDAQFALATTLGRLKRHSEAETRFRQGLALLQPLVGDAATRPGKAARKARDWARYFELHLKDNLISQGRMRESRLLVSIIPRQTGGADTTAADFDEPERAGVGTIAGIATDMRAGPGGLRPLTPEEQARRDMLEASAVRFAQAASHAEERAALSEILDIDLRVFAAGSPAIAFDRARIAQAAFDEGNARLAREQAEQAISVYETLGDQYGRPFAAALRVLADAVEQQGDLRAAEAHLRRAVSLRGVKGVDAYVLIDLAANLFAQGRASDAEAVYREALSLNRLDRATGHEVRVFLAWLAWRAGDYAKSAEAYRAVCGDMAELAAQSARGFRATNARGSQREAAAQCAMRQAWTLWDWSRATPQQAPGGTFAESFAAAQRASVDPSADALALAGARAEAARRGLGADLDQLEAAIRERDAIGGAPPEDLFGAVYQPGTPDDEARRERFNAGIAALSAKIAAAAPRFWQLRRPEPVSVAALQATRGSDATLLRADEALVLFMIRPGGQSGVVYAISKARSGWAEISMSGDEISRAVGKIRASIDAGGYDGLRNAESDPGSMAFDRATAHALYIALFGAPEVKAVLDPCGTWLLVPTGALTALPFAALVTQPPEGGADADGDDDALRATRWLMREKALSVLPSVSALRTIRQILPAERKTATDPLLILANPANAPGAPKSSATPGAKLRGFRAFYRNGAPDAAMLGTLPELSYAEVEARALQQGLKAGVEALLMHDRASKAELMARNIAGSLARVRILGFATHGLAGGSGDALSEPALVLAAATKPEDWILKASEAATLRLNADWVLLTGCNTASPDYAGADGLSGFARAFFFAGASTLLVSHWRVNDQVAASLVPSAVVGSYGTKRASRATSLQRAMISILDDAVNGDPHPASWAVFALVGEPG
jgi:CHAT domain-containing protein/tetratricopeptide (TPR) repeat protein